MIDATLNPAPCILRRCLRRRRLSSHGVRTAFVSSSIPSEPISSHRAESVSPLLVLRGVDSEPIGSHLADSVTPHAYTSASPPSSSPVALPTFDTHPPEEISRSTQRLKETNKVK